MKVDPLIVIDANQYLNLYRVTKEKKLLAPLSEQEEYIFVTVQIVEEVQRNKLRVAANFLSSQFEELKIRKFDVPDHLFDIAEDTASKLREKLGDIGERIKAVNTYLTNAAVDTLRRISCSEDEVSKALAGLFNKAVAPTPEEIQRARERKERGNPPGKKGDPLGDQLTWEQLLCHCKDNSKLWIISKDSDYSTRHSGKMFLNPLLYQDLIRMNQPIPEVVCFDSIDEGIRDFVQTTGVKAERLPTPEESKEIKEELDSLPPLDWLPSSFEILNANVVPLLWRRRQTAAPYLMTGQSRYSGWLHPGAAGLMEEAAKVHEKDKNPSKD
jgi:hypothetical protein